MPCKPVVCVVDTNVVVAGLITANTDSPTVRILDSLLEGNILYLMSAALLSEYASVLRRSKIASLHQLSDEHIDMLLTELVANTIWREPDSEEDAPDPGDNHLWSLLASHADSILVTGDQLLLKNPPSSYSVISPRSFAEAYLPQPG